MGEGPNEGADIVNKPKRPSLTGMVQPAPSHENTAAQSHDDVIVQLRDDEVPNVMSVTPSASEVVEPVTTATSAISRVRKARAKPQAEEAAGMAHRSLYASPETLDLIRRIAFEERISAQSLYREGLLLMLQARGHYQHKSVDDV